MKEYLKYRKIFSFTKVDNKDLGRFILAGIVLNLIVSRVYMQSPGDINSFPFPLMLCVAILYGGIYNPLNNTPQFTKELAYTSRQEVKLCILTAIEFLMWLGVFYTVFTVIAITIAGWKPDFSVDYGNVLRSVIFYVFYNLFVFALMFPLAMIKHKKTWYLVFSGVALFLAVLTLGMVNFFAEGKFRTYTMVTDHLIKMKDADAFLCIMGVVTICVIIVSYHIAQKLHEPKRY